MMRNWMKWPLIVAVFVFGVAFGLVGDGLTSQTYFPTTPLACGWEYVQIEGRGADGHFAYRLMPRRKPGLGIPNTDLAWEASCFARKAYLQSLKNSELLHQILKNQTGRVKGQPNALTGGILNGRQGGSWMK